MEFCLDPFGGDPVTPWLLDHDWIDEPVMRAFLGMVIPGARVIDLGCHLGTFSLPAAALGAEVIAVDAWARHVHLLRLAARRNRFKHLHAVHGVISDGDQPVPFIERSIHGRVVAEEDAESPTTTVPPLSVDDLVESHGWDRVDAIKMDIEGCEPAALRGMERLFSRGHRPAIVFECNGGMLPIFGSSTGELRQAIAALGYELLLIDHLNPGKLVETHPDAVQTECVCDYLALAERPDKLARDWTIDPPFSRQQTVARLLETAADEAAGYRRYAADLLATGPDWLRGEPVTALTMRALEGDVNESVRTAIEQSPPVSHLNEVAPPPEGSADDVIVYAARVCLAAARTEADRPVSNGSPPADLAVRELSFHLEAGHSLGVLVDQDEVGSALVHALSGEVTPVAGELTIRGRAVSVANLSCVVEPELTVGENLAVLAAFLGCDVRTVGPRVGHLADRAGVGHLIETRLADMPEEVQTRLGITVALECTGPDLLILGQLASVEDRGVRVWLHDRINQLKATGMAVIQITRDPDELLAGADRMLWIDGTQPRAWGHPSAVVDGWRAAACAERPVGASWE